MIFNFVVVFLISSACVFRGVYNAEKCKDENMDIVFMVDASSSINNNIPPDKNINNWSLVRSFIEEVGKLLPIKQKKARALVVPFSTAINGIIPALYDDLDGLLKFIRDLPYYGGNTNISGALRQARWILTNSTSYYPTTPKQVLVLITDGFSNVDASQTLQEARINKQLGIIQFAVGITQFTNEDELQDLVSDPSSYHYLNASDFSHLNLIINELLQRLTCNEPPPPDQCRDTRADIVFILDASGSIVFMNEDMTTQNLTNWITMKNFFISVVRSLNIGPQQTRVALIRFSFQADVIFYLDTYSNKDDIIKAITDLEIVASVTNTSGALRVMNNEVFTPQHGDRPDMHNVAILMTDGQSNVNESGTIPEAKRAKSLGVRMFAIGLTEQINSDELKSMSSRPLDLHYFNRTTYSLANTVVSNLVWNVCHGTCIENGDTCAGGIPTRCRPNEEFSWIKYPGSLIIGHDYARLTDIATADSCKSICLQDALCRSIEYLSSYQECSVSYYRKADAVDSFRKDPEVDYYEWTCS